MDEGEKSMEKKEHEELMELSHEPVPGYKTAYYLILAAAVCYLAVILWRTM